MKTQDDAVNPKHYSDFGEYAAVIIIRRWNVIRAHIPGARPVSFNVGNALKYMQRAGIKPGEAEVRDLAKAMWYIENELHELDPDHYPDPAGVDTPTQ